MPTYLSIIHSGFTCLTYLSIIQWIYMSHLPINHSVELHSPPTCRSFTGFTCPTYLSIIQWIYTSHLPINHSVELHSPPTCQSFTEFTCPTYLSIIHWIYMPHLPVNHSLDLHAPPTCLSIIQQIDMPLLPASFTAVLHTSACTYIGSVLLQLYWACVSFASPEKFCRISKQMLMVRYIRPFHFFNWYI